MLKTLLIDIKGLPHCPRNRSHFISINWKKKTPMTSKTEAGISYGKAIQFHLKKYKAEVEEFYNTYDAKIHRLKVEWEIFSPEVETANGNISLTGTDLDAHKILQDQIFEFLGLNDGIIKRDTREKFQGDYRILIELKLVDKDSCRSRLSVTDGSYLL